MIDHNNPTYYEHKSTNFGLENKWTSRYLVLILLYPYLYIPFDIDYFGSSSDF